MKKILNSILLLLCVLAFPSCEKDLSDQESTSITWENGDTSKKMILIRKRSEPSIISTNTDSIYRELDKDGGSNITRTSSDRYLRNLGYGFNFNNKFPIENPLNMTFPVVDSYKIYENDNSNISIDNLLTTDSRYFAFANSDYYYTNSEMSKTLKSGSSFGIGSLIKGGVDATYKDVFKTSSSDDNRLVYGELSIYVDRYRLALNSGNTYIYSEKYITSGFRNTLYENSILRTLSIYGTHVLVNYSLGGSANALYKGVSKASTDVETRESSLEIALRGSFKLFSSNLSFSLSSKLKDSIASRFSDVDISIKTIGGDTGYGITTYTSPEDIYNINIDLSSWAKSVDDNNAVLNRINAGGLIPIYELVLEDNFRKILEEYSSRSNLSDYLSNHSSKLYEPFVFHALIYIGSNKPYLGTFLVSRHNTTILLGLKEIPSSSLNPLQYIFQLATSEECEEHGYKALIYGESIFEGLTTYVGEEPWLSVSSLNSLYDQYYDFTNIDKNSMKLCRIEGQDIKYLTFVSNGKKYALGIYSDYILDTYGLDEAKNMTVEKIATLRGYTVIGL